jgi:hypothetical protein
MQKLTTAPVPVAIKRFCYCCLALVSESAIGVRLLADTGFWVWNWRISIANGDSSPCG